MKYVRDNSLNTNKLDDDKYYTPIELARKCIDKTLEIIGFENISEIIEPSAGNGSFSKQIKNCIAYDIEPEDISIIRKDFLQLDIEYKKGRLCIGNPPFGPQNFLSVKFYIKCCQIGDYVAFILPISQLKESHQLYHFDLIYSKDLGQREYTDRKIHCCFNIYKRPSSGKINKRKKYNFEDIKIFERRNVKGNVKKFKIDDYDLRMCGWGARCGQILKDHEIFAKEFAIKIYNHTMKEKIIQTIKNLDIKEFNIVSTPNISQMMLYSWLKKKIPELK